MTSKNLTPPWPPVQKRGRFAIWTCCPDHLVCPETGVQKVLHTAPKTPLLFDPRPYNLVKNGAEIEGPLFPLLVLQIGPFLSPSLILFGPKISKVKKWFFQGSIFLTSFWPAYEATQVLRPPPPKKTKNATKIWTISNRFKNVPQEAKKKIGHIGP